MLKLNRNFLKFFIRYYMFYPGREHSLLNYGVKLSDIGESQAIERLRVALRQLALPSDWVGIGDDAAVCQTEPGLAVLTTVDMLVEEVHFKRSTIAPGDLGWKALAVNVSDIFGMGGVPRWCVVALALPGELKVSWLEEFYRGLAQAALAYDTRIVGGDTVGTPGPIVVSLSVIGQAQKPRLRSEACPGDLLVATGPHGLARAGHWALEHPLAAVSHAMAELAMRSQARPAPPGYPATLAALPRLALLDDSDGLGRSMTLLAEASGVAVVLQTNRLKIHPAVAAIAHAAGSDPLDWVLWGGEDYGLVGATPDLPSATGFRVIGKVEMGAGAWLEDSTGRHPLTNHAFRHF
ncbi:MAG: thiamine-phosphate kinase [Cyanobacteria bacterium NC_groundwater_1444_Ag_S-0.65um_54_12]|nr:thiamine-phosphate kinase [Cyanobacteria bacterium NC_groundwater_1444_Ag_S-0.65um_54_12]